MGASGETCPYCFESFRLGHTPFRCLNPTERCSAEIDEKRSEVWGEAGPLGKVLPPAGFSPKDALCPQCGELSRQRLCPHCHMELPRTIGQFRNFIFAIIGAKEAGKSHYLAVLIEQLRQQIGPELKILLEPANDATIRRYRDDFHQPLYRGRDGRRQVLDATRSARQRASAVRTPLVYVLSIQGRDFFGRKKIVAVVTLTFFDTAGEDLDDENTMATVNKYIYRSDGIILLLDPLQILAVRERLPPARLPTINSETRDILSRTTKLILRGRQFPAGRPIPTPLAIAFSKLDRLAPLIEPHMQIHCDANHSGGFDLQDAQAVDSEIQALLAGWDCGDLLGQVEGHYARHAFFALSALGCEPDDQGFLPRILPRRVEDPFLWLLHCHGLLKARGSR